MLRGENVFFEEIYIQLSGFLFVTKNDNFKALLSGLWALWNSQLTEGQS